MSAPTFTHKGHVFTVTHEHDADHPAPWDDGDGRGIVTEWIRNEGADVPADLWVLASDRGARRYFDHAATMAKAHAEGWGLAPDADAALIVALGRMPEPADITADAVRREFECLRGWCRDEWAYVGVIVRLQGTDLTESLWGVESNSGAYLDEVARELADQILEEAPDTLGAEITRLTAVRNAIIHTKDTK